MESKKFLKEWQKEVENKLESIRTEIEKLEEEKSAKQLKLIIYQEPKLLDYFKDEINELKTGIKDIDSKIKSLGDKIIKYENLDRVLNIKIKHQEMRQRS